MQKRANIGTQATPSDKEQPVHSGPYNFNSPSDRQMMSDSIGDIENASPFETKFTVLKFNSGTKTTNKSTGKFRKKRSLATNHSPSKSFQHRDRIFKQPPLPLNPEDQNDHHEPKRLLDLHLDENIFGQ
jgi:hypothetical protein